MSLWSGREKSSFYVSQLHSCLESPGLAPEVRDTVVRYGRKSRSVYEILKHT